MLAKKNSKIVLFARKAFFAYNASLIFNFFLEAKVSLRVNREIRGDKVRVIDANGEQVGILTVREALLLAERQGLDLVEISPTSAPPVCRVMDYGKFRYQQTKKEKENKKGIHQPKVKEIKIKPNIDVHDLNTKLKHAREFLLKGNKVRVSCMFRGREMLHSELGEKVVNRFCEALQDIAIMESRPKRLGRILQTVLAPGKPKKQEKQSAQNEDTQSGKGPV